MKFEIDLIVWKYDTYIENLQNILEFEIDLIVWKFMYILGGNTYPHKFEIDLIVWKYGEDDLSGSFGKGV